MSIDQPGGPVNPVCATPMHASDIQWSTSQPARDPELPVEWRERDAAVFENLDVDLRSLSPFALALYVDELRAECRFVRTAWHAASERLRIVVALLDRDLLRAALQPYRDGITQQLLAEIEARE